MKILVAGVGNIFFSDDGFGSAVARALAADANETVRVVDSGIAGVHLAYDLVAGYDRVVIVDTIRRDVPPGTLVIVEPNAQERFGVADPHEMELANTFAFARALGGDLPPITIVGVVPACIDEGMRLSAAVEAAIEPACAAVRTLVDDWRNASVSKTRETETV